MRERWNRVRQGRYRSEANMALKVNAVSNAQSVTLDSCSTNSAQISFPFGRCQVFCSPQIVITVVDTRFPLTRTVLVSCVRSAHLQVNILQTTGNFGTVILGVVA